MRIPTLKEEKSFWRKGYKLVAGLDEVGRGPLAGPVVAGAFIVLPGFRMPRALQKQLRDSKKLSERKRLEFYYFFHSHPHVKWGIGIVSETMIDRINILQATRLAMKKALAKVQKADSIIVDGNMVIESTLFQKAIVKGDESVFSCAAASIMAKVTRDRIMVRYHKKYPAYGFDKHKGYGTRLHMKNLRKHGPSSIHRRTFLSFLNTLTK
ncbi:MAG: ribonuclease HII [bacterium]|nr:ribonuclease HII [bacterium]